MTNGTHKAVYAALAGNLAIAVTKAVAAGLTASSVMMTEALHSLIDTGNEGLLLIGLRRASRAPDESHPFGYGLEVYFWAFVVALLIFSLGGGLAVYQGVQHIRHPLTVTQPWINFVVLGLAFIFEALSFRVAWREFAKARRDVPVLTAISRSKDPALFSVLLEDGAALAGLILAAIGLAATVWLDWRWADGAASVMIGVVLITVAIFMANETRSLMSGEAAAPRTVAAVRALLEAEPAVEKVLEVMTMHLGPNAILLAITLDYRDDLPVHTAEEVTARFSAQIRKLDSRIGRIFVRSAKALSGAGAV
jgi:cation diffusion facilitator family transporter